MEKQQTVDEIPSPEELIVLNEEWSVGKTIGQGQFGTVYHAYRSNGERVAGSDSNHAAAKIYHGHITSSSIFDAESVFDAEKESLSSLDHPGIVRILDSFTVSDHYDITQEKPVIIMGYEPGPTLEHVIKTRGPMHEDRAAVIVAKTAGGVVYMQERQGIAHKDLGPQNVKLREGDEPVILDFGLARPITEELQTQLLRSRVAGKEFRQFYVPPEVDAGISTLNTDLYSLAMLWKDMLLGKFGGLTLKDHELLGINPGVRELIQRNLSLEYKNRSPDAKTFLEGLERIIGRSLPVQVQIQEVQPSEVYGDSNLPAVIDNGDGTLSFGGFIDREGNITFERFGRLKFEKKDSVYETAKNLRGDIENKMGGKGIIDSPYSSKFQTVRSKLTLAYLQHAAQEHPILQPVVAGEKTLPELYEEVKAGKPSLTKAILRSLYELRNLLPGLTPYTVKSDPFSVISEYKQARKAYNERVGELEKVISGARGALYPFTY